MFRKKDKKEVIKRIFDGFISEEALDQIPFEKESSSQIRLGLVNYILINVDEGSSGVLDLIEAVAENILENGGVINSILASFMLATFPVDAKSESSSRLMKLQDVANSLIQISSNKLRIIFGSMEMYYGNLGSKSSYRYGPMIPNFNQKIELLLRLDFGQSRIDS